MALALCFSLLPTAALAEEAGAAPDAANANSTYTTGENTGLTGGKDGSVPDGTDGGDADSSGEAQDGEADTAVSAVQEAPHANHCVCGKDSTTVNGHTHSTNTAWKAANSLPGSAGNYYLTQSVSENWAVPAGEVTLCLNGQTINGSITVGGSAKLTLTDCSGNGKIQGGVTVNGGKFELYSGTITGGVQVGIKGGSYQTGSSFTMYGGAITGNRTDSGAGGGVFLVGTTNHIDPPSFTMHGGTISDNTAGASDGGGGGVYVGEKCSFTMDGGTITGNTATNGNGGGIYIHMLAKVTISGGEITNNKAPAKNSTSYGHGGGIYSESGVTVKNVTITGNNSNFEGGGIYGKGTINLTDATVTDNNRYDVYYGGVENSNHKLTVSGSVKAGYYANNDWKLPIFVSGALSENSVIRVGMYEGIKPGYGSKVTLAEPANGVKLRAENFEADAADCVTSLGGDGKVYLARCAHMMDSTGYTCEKCKTQFDARVGESAYYQTLAEAFLKAWDGSTITLLRDVTLTGNCSAPNTITLDLHGKTITSGDKFFNVNNKLTVKDSSEGGGTQALNVKFWVNTNGTLAVDNSYTGEISRVELQAGGALEAYTGTIQELLLGKGNGTGYSVKLWKGNAHCCTVKKITLAKDADQALTVGGLLKTNHAKCELYGEKGGAWSIVPKTKKISELTGYTAYKVQFQECVHQCADDTVEKPVCSKCGKVLVVKITATASDGKIKTAWFPVGSGIENGDGYVEAIQTLNGWSAEGYTDATLMPLCDVHNNSGGIGIASVTLTGKLTVDGGKHLIYSTTIASDADVTFKTGRFYYITVNGKASFVGGTYLGGVTASSGAEAVFSGGAYQYLNVEDGGTAVVKNSAAFGEDVEVIKGTLTVEGGSFGAAVVVESDGTMNVNGGSFTGTGINKVTYSGGAKGTISGGSFADLYLYSSGTAWLAGGSFTKLSTASTGVLSSLLADGAAYYDQKDSAISGSAVSELNDVTVKTHAHTVDKETGICSVCKKQMAASLTAGNETSWYLTLDAAIAAANGADGEKTIKLYQDVPTTAPSYELTRGPVTLDVNGKKALGTFTVKGIQLTVTGTGTIRDVTASGSSAVVKNSTVNINYIEAESGGRLELGGGSYFGLTVINDGSSASLSGGTYKSIEWGSSYVRANEYLADGYGYKTSDGTWDDGTASVNNATVTPAPIKSTKVYPNSEMNYSGSTFDAKDTSVTLTVSVTSDESAGLTYTWYRSINDEWCPLTSPYTTKDLTEKYTGAGSRTLSITELPAGQTFSYKVQIATSDGYKCFSKPFTVTRHQHSWTYTASGATITAKCTAEDCYLTDKLGGTFTISAPAANTLTYDGNAKEAAAKLDAVSGVTSLPTVGDITYMQNGKTLPSAPVNAGEYTASITVGEGNKAATATVNWEITQKALTLTGATATGRSYVENNKSVEISGVTFAGGTTLNKGTDYNVTGMMDDDNAGSKTVHVAVTLIGSAASNYTLTPNTIDTTVTITQATTPAAPTGLTGVKGQPLSTVSLAAHPGWSWADGTATMNTAGLHNFDANYHDANGNYANGTKSVSVNVVDKTDAGVTISGVPASKTYGEADFTLTATKIAPDSGTWSWVSSDDTILEIVSGAATATPTIKVKKADANGATLTVTYESDTRMGSASATITVARKEVTISGITANNKEYDGNTSATVNASGATITGKVDGDDLTVSVATGSTFDSADAGSRTVTLGTLTLDGTSAGNYTLATSGNQTTATANITVRDLTVKPDSGQSKSYGTTPDPVLAYTSTGTVTGETAAFDGALSREAGEDVGQYDITKGSLELKDSGTFKAANYNLVLDTAVVTFEITKGTYGGSAPTKTVNILKNYAGVQTGTLTAADFFTTAPAEAKITNAVPNSKPSSMMSLVGADSSGNFTYDSKTNITAASDESWTVTISSKNYTNITGTLTFKLVDKTDVSAQITFPNGALTYNGAGQKYEKATISGVSGGTWNYTYAANSGTGASLDSAGLPKTAGTYTVTAKYEDDAHIGIKPATLTVSKATPTGAPTCTKITTSGKTLADAPLAIGTIAPAGGTLAWDMAANTVVAANTAYGWTYIPADTANYKALTGSLTPYAVSSGGGGGSAATPSVSDKAAKELKNAKEGSTVTIDMKGETKLPASVTKEIAGKDVTVELDMGGGMVWSFNGLDVPKGGVRLDLGVKTGTKTIPAKVINALTGEATTIQLQLNRNGPFGMSLKLSVDLGKKHDGLYANLYIYNPKSGELEFQSAGMISGGKASWVFDHASDYAIVIDKESHEPMTFTDVPDTAYYAEAVNWAVAKKITEGVGNKLFGSNDPCTRAQIVTFLWRAAGSPGPKTMSGFSDVPADSYYAKAVAWAVENGITGGTGDGKFSPDATCTRAQAVTFLYRASGAPAVSGNAAFSDVATNAYYAAAVKWAEKNGITGGIGGGLFGSDNNCTRAQIVTFLYRSYQSK